MKESLFARYWSSLVDVQVWFEGTPKGQTHVFFWGGEPFLMIALFELVSKDTYRSSNVVGFLYLRHTNTHAQRHANTQSDMCFPECASWQLQLLCQDLKYEYKALKRVLASRAGRWTIRKPSLKWLIGEIYVFGVCL